MLKKLLRRWAKKLIEESYVRGLAVGYNVGVQFGKSEVSGSGVIVSARVRQEIDAILMRNGF